MHKLDVLNKCLISSLLDGCNMAYFFYQEWATVMMFILHMLNKPPIRPGWNQAHVAIPFTKNNFHGKKSIFFNN